MKAHLNGEAEGPRSNVQLGGWKAGVRRRKTKAPPHIVRRRSTVNVNNRRSQLLDNLRSHHLISQEKNDSFRLGSHKSNKIVPVDGDCDFSKKNSEDEIDSGTKFSKDDQPEKANQSLISFKTAMHDMTTVVKKPVFQLSASTVLTLVILILLATCQFWYPLYGYYVPHWTYDGWGGPLFWASLTELTRGEMKEYNMHMAIQAGQEIDFWGNINDK